MAHEPLACIDTNVKNVKGQRHRVITCATGVSLKADMTEDFVS